MEIYWRGNQWLSRQADACSSHLQSQDYWKGLIVFDYCLGHFYPYKAFCTCVSVHVRQFRPVSPVVCWFYWFRCTVKRFSLTQWYTLASLMLVIDLLRKTTVRRSVWFIRYLRWCFVLIRIPHSLFQVCLFWFTTNFTNVFHQGCI